MKSFDALSQGLSGERPLLFFGAGQNARQWIEPLAGLGKSPAAVIDETPQKQSENILGVPILSPQKAWQAYGADAVVLVTVFVPGVSYQFLKAKIASFGFSKIGSIAELLHFFPELPFYYFSGAAPSREFKEAADFLALHWVDPISAEHARSFSRAQFELDPSLAAPPRPQDYFLADQVNLPDNMTYIDAGAYRGDTLLKYFEARPFQASEILAFEPDARNFEALQAYAETLGQKKEPLRLENKAVGRRHGRVKFEALCNFSSRVSPSGESEVEVVRIDDLAEAGRSYFIKFDVEGAELDALSGCESILRAGRSLVAVSVYHRREDLTLISRLLLRQFPDVQLYFRTLDENGMDSMVYAAPKAWIRCPRP